MGARTSAFRENRKGEKVERKTLIGVYYCRQIHVGHVSPDCPRSIGTKKADDYVWEKVCMAINSPDILIAKAHGAVDDLRNNAQALYDDKDRLQKELDAITLERQWIITQARKRSITESDMDYQLGSLTLQELTLKRELVTVGSAMDIYTLDNWDMQVKEYFADLQAGIESLNTAPQNDEERREMFEIKQQIVNTLVKKVTIDRNRELTVHFSLNLWQILQDQAKKQGTTGGGGGSGKGGSSAVPIETVGIYTRRRSTRAHRRRCAFFA